MKVVILAGGLGSRLCEETETLPKPMVHIGGKPILWHIMRHYAHYGFNEFVIALGYKGEEIKRFFLEYRSLSSDITLELATGRIDTHGSASEDWRVHLIDTGLEVNTGGRLRRLQRLLCEETFLLTYGDGVSNVNLAGLLQFHRARRNTATVTTVRPPGRFGGVQVEGDMVAHFKEKPETGEGWINGGYMVLEPEVFSYLRDDKASLEIDALERLASERKLAAFRHDRFWQCVDTLREKRYLESIWNSGQAPWRY